MPRTTEKARRVARRERPIRMPPRPRIIAVLGMHRSGTSVITRGLEGLGVPLGETLMPPSKGDNDKGFFEDLDIYRFHERILGKLQSGWDWMGPIDSAALRGPSFSDERREAIALLEGKLQGRHLFAFKDPRTAVLLPLWHCAFEDLDLDDRYLIAVRNPLECAASLFLRNQIPLAKGIALWAKYNLNALRHTQDKRRTFVSYVNMLSSPQTELARLAAALELPAPEPSSECVKLYVEEFLAGELRRNRVSTCELRRSGVAPPLVAELYELLETCSSDEKRSIDAAQTQMLETRFAELDPMLSFADTITHEQRTLKQENRALLKRADEAEQTVKRSADELTAMEEARSREQRQLSAQIENLTRDAEAARASQRDALARGDQLQAELLALQAARTEQQRQFNAQIEHLGRAVEIADARRCEAAARADQLHADLAALETSRAAERQELTAQINALRMRVEAAEAGKCEAADRADRLQSDLVALEAAHAAERQELTAEIDTLRVRLEAMDARRRETAEQVERLQTDRLALQDAQVDLQRQQAVQVEGLLRAVATAQSMECEALAHGHKLQAELDRLSSARLAERQVLAAQIEELLRAAEMARANETEVVGRCNQLKSDFDTLELARRDEQDHLQAQIEASRAKLEDLQHALATAEAALAAEQDASATRFRELEGRLAQHEATSVQAIEQAQSVAALAQEQLTRERQSAAQRQGELEAALTAARTVIETTCTQVGTIERALQTERAEASAHIDSIRAEAQRQKDTSAELSQVAARQLSELEAAKNESAELRRDLLLARGSLTATRASTSWRITAPLRGVRLLVRGSLRALSARAARVRTAMRLRLSPQRPARAASSTRDRREQSGADDSAPGGHSGGSLAPRFRAQSSASGGGVVIVVHDMHRHGAQYVALNIARTLKHRFGLSVASVSASDVGELANEFRAVGSLHVITPFTPAAEIDRVIGALAAKGFRRAIVNSAAAGWLAPHLTRHGLEFTALVHELPGMIRSRRLENAIRDLHAQARTVVYPADRVLDRVSAATGVRADRTLIQPQGLYQRISLIDGEQKRAARHRVCASIGAAANSHIVLGVGYADLRKGVDIFIDWAMATLRRRTDVHFVWAGKIAPELETLIRERLAWVGQHAQRIHFVGFDANPSDYYLAASVYALSSREDPFPSTLLEALAAGTPAILCAGASGAETLAEGCVTVLADAQASTFADTIEVMLDAPEALLRRGLEGRDLVRARFGFASYAGAIVDTLGLDLAQVSVVVPNYNYRHYLERRLDSILQQTLAPREILFLDDASSDDSIAVAERMLSGCDINWRIVRNPHNSGCVFSQWQKGVELTQSRLLWIAEADDDADPHFLENASRAFERADVVLSYTQSKQIDERGTILALDYLDYLDDIDPIKWRSSFVADGLQEVRSSLAVKNSIPNVSGVLFDRACLARVLREHRAEIASYRVAGDWCVYVNMLRHGAIAFDTAALNLHRRHEVSVTTARFGLPELAEIARMQNYVAREFCIDAEQAEKARAYLAKLVHQFQLPKQYSRADIAGALRGMIAA